MFPSCACSVHVSSLFVAHGGFLRVHIHECDTPSLARSVFVLHGHYLRRGFVFVLIVSVAIFKNAI